MSARILVIEDNPANMELMTYLLRAFGHTTHTARDGREGLEVAARERPDLIICDAQLPVLNGVEVAQRLKADPALRAIPLIAVTAFARPEDRNQMLAAGFNGYFSKPISPETFVQQVQAFLHAGQRSASTSAQSMAVDAAMPRQQGRTVLAVDDRQVNLQLASSILGGSGYTVITARTMTEALRLAVETVPDLILSDVCMEAGTGYDFIRSVKAHPRLRAIPFVFLTSTMTTESARREGLALGAAKYLFRPMEPQALLRELEACLAGGG
jgi:two-component system cell cycle response regulator